MAQDEIAQRVGFVGLGIMGGRMIRQLLQGGVDLTVHDLDAAAIQAAVDAGAKVAETPKELGAVCDVVIAMLPSPQILEAVALGTDGLIEGMAAGSLPRRYGDRRHVGRQAFGGTACGKGYSHDRCTGRARSRGG